MAAFRADENFFAKPLYKALRLCYIEAGALSQTLLEGETQQTARCIVGYRHLSNILRLIKQQTLSCHPRPTKIAVEVSSCSR